MHDDTQRAFALVGPGRAGTTLARALAARGWRCVGVAGRAIDAPERARRRRAPRRADARGGRRGPRRRSRDRVHARRGDRRHRGRRSRRACAPGRLVVHLSGVCTLAELDKLRGQRPDVAVGSLHPLQSFPSPEVGVTRLPGSWCAVDGPPDVERIARVARAPPVPDRRLAARRVPRDRHDRVQPSRRADGSGGTPRGSRRRPPCRAAPARAVDARECRHVRAGGCAHRAHPARRRRHRRSAPRRAPGRRAARVPCAGRAGVAALRPRRSDAPRPAAGTGIGPSPGSSR